MKKLIKLFKAISELLSHWAKTVEMGSVEEKLTFCGCICPARGGAWWLWDSERDRESESSVLF